uniref:Protein kinase domain-containing protein n=2 Tax=Rhizophagus irregularis (strain DAOM 181602 / DAOM 197198 / MUCL 43194) TaxID=747089 RepID=U9U864_RHIID
MEKKEINKIRLDYYYFTITNNNKINKMQTTKNANECINWIEESISREYYRFYEQEYFSNVQRIGTGGFGKVYRANWKNSDQYLALKSFFNLDDVTAKEIVHEV